jgi:hypothetical protein
MDGLISELLHPIKGEVSCFKEVFTSPQALLRVIPALCPLIIEPSINIVKNKNPIKFSVIHLHLTKDGDLLGEWVKVLSLKVEFF